MQPKNEAMKARTTDNRRPLCAHGYAEYRCKCGYVVRVNIGEGAACKLCGTCLGNKGMEQQEGGDEI